MSDLEHYICLIGVGFVESIPLDVSQIHELFPWSP